MLDGVAPTYVVAYAGARVHALLSRILIKMLLQLQA